MVQSLTCLILKRKNILSKIWLAAHWDKKLTRYHILQIDIEKCISDIIHQEIILDLRLSGHLLVGIVKIFSRKAKYLLNECTEILSRVRVFRADMTELPPRKLTAPVKSITLPELFENVDNLELKKMDEDDIFQSLQSNVDDITLKETAYDTRLINEDEHFDIFGEENVPMDFEENIQLSTLLDDGGDKEFYNGVEPENGSSNSSDGCSVRHISDSQEVISQMRVSDSQELVSLWLSDKVFKPKDNKLNLEPLSNNFDGIQRIKKQKRKLIIDDVKSMSKEKIDKQVQEFSNLILPLDIAPPSKRLMILKEIGNAKQLFHQPGLKIANKEIKNLFNRNLRVSKTEEMVEDSTSSEETDLSLFDGPRGNFFGDKSAPANGFHETNSLPNEFNNQQELFNKDALAENAMNSDSSLKDFEYFHELKDSVTEDIQLSIETEQDSGCSSNEVNSICQEKIIELLQKLKLLFKETKEIKFSSLVKAYRKRKVAQTFHSMLMVKKYNIVEIKQTQPYGEIFITKGTNFVVACEDIL